MLFENKGQASAEFIFVTLIVLIIMGGVISLIGGAQDKTQTGNLGGARVLGEKIAETINTVYINGNGYSIDLDLRTLNQTLTSTSNPFSFTATISNGTTGGIVTVTTSGKSVGVNTIPKSYNGTLTLTNNKLYHVKNVNGTIVITT